MSGRNTDWYREQANQAAAAALEAMARGEAVGSDADESDTPLPRVQKESPLRRTQRIRICGRTIKSGLE